MQRIPTLDHPRHGTTPVTSHVYKLKQISETLAAPQKSAEWYVMRQNFLTASAIASALGKNPYETRNQLMLKKILPHTDVFVTNEAIEHGNRHEMTAIMKYESITGRRVFSFDCIQSLNEDENFLAGSPDGITSCGRLIEVKCPFRRKLSGEVPAYYIYQVQYLMHMLHLKVCDFVQYGPGNTWQEEEIYITEIHYDPLLIHETRPVLVGFWNEVNEKKGLLQRNGDLDPSLHLVPTSAKRPRPINSFDANSTRNFRSRIDVNGCKIIATESDLATMQQHGQEEENQDAEMDYDDDEDYSMFTQAPSKCTITR